MKIVRLDLEPSSISERLELWRRVAWVAKGAKVAKGRRCWDGEGRREARDEDKVAADDEHERREEALSAKDMRYVTPPQKRPAP